MMRWHLFGWLQLAALLVAMTVGGPTPAPAGLSSRPRDATWVTDGPVHAIAVGNGVTYLGGDFNYIGPCTGHGAPINTTTGQAAVKFPKVNGTINACVSDDMGGWFIGGDFAIVGGLVRNRIAHILANGTVDVWNPNANGVVYSLLVSGSTVYAGGAFTNIGGQTCNRIAALDSVTGVATGWNPNADGTVYALAVSGTAVYAGGAFTSIGGQPRNCIASLGTTTGAATVWNPNASGDDLSTSVTTLVISGSTVYAGGNFTNIGGQTRNYIAALDAITGLAKDWNPNADGTVYTLAISGLTVYAGGEFTNIGGQARKYIAAVDASTGAVTEWNPNVDGKSPCIYTLAVSDRTVYAGGNFSSIGGQARNNIANLDAETGAVSAWNPNASNSVRALAVSGLIAYVGGDFLSIGGRTRNCIAALDVSTGAATDWNPNVNVNDNSLWKGVYTLAVSGSIIYVGGHFTSIGGQARNNIAALDTSTGAATNWNPDVNGTSINTYIHALAVSDRTVYAVGNFSSIGGQSRNSIAALDTSTGAATDWNPNVEGYYGVAINALAVSGTTVYVGGLFTSMGGQKRNCIAALDASTGTATAWNPDPKDRDVFRPTVVDALVTSGTTIYAGGWFNSIGGQVRNHVAALDSITGAATSWDPDAYGRGLSYSIISSLVVSGSSVYAGGWFTAIGRRWRNNIASLDVKTGIATVWDPDASNGNDAAYIRALAVSGSTVYVGGVFDSIGGQPRPNFAQFDMEAGAEDWRLFE